MLRAVAIVGILSVALAGCDDRAPESALYGIWQPDPHEEMYYKLDPDHTASVVATFTGEMKPIIRGRWYAGGPNLYLRFPPDESGPTRPTIWHILDISPNELRLRWSQDQPVSIWRRVALNSRSASNQTIRPTAGRSEANH